MNNLVAIVAVIVTFIAPAVVIIFLARYRHMQKMEMIRRGINPDIYTTTYQGAKSLLLGLLLAFLGIVALIFTIILSGYQV